MRHRYLWAVTSSRFRSGCQSAVGSRSASSVSRTRPKSASAYVLIVVFGLHTTAATLPDSGRLSVSAAPDFRILLSTLAVTIVTALVFGLVPALKTTKPDIGKTLKDQAGAVVGGGSTARRSSASASARFPAWASCMPRSACASASGTDCDRPGDAELRTSNMQAQATGKRSPKARDSQPRERWREGER